MDDTFKLLYTPGPPPPPPPSRAVLPPACEPMPSDKRACSSPVMCWTVCTPTRQLGKAECPGWHHFGGPLTAAAETVAYGCRRERTVDLGLCWEDYRGEGWGGRQLISSPPRNRVRYETRHTLIKKSGTKRKRDIYKSLLEMWVLDIPGQPCPTPTQHRSGGSKRPLFPRQTYE